MFSVVCHFSLGGRPLGVCELLGFLLPAKKFWEPKDEGRKKKKIDNINQLYILDEFVFFFFFFLLFLLFFFFFFSSSLFFFFFAFFSLRSLARNFFFFFFFDAS